METVLRRAPHLHCMSLARVKLWVHSEPASWYRPALRSTRPAPEAAFLDAPHKGESLGHLVEIWVVFSREGENDVEIAAGWGAGWRSGAEGRQRNRQDGGEAMMPGTGEEMSPGKGGPTSENCREN